jgi:pectate lyase
MNRRCRRLAGLIVTSLLGACLLGPALTGQAADAPAVPAFPGAEGFGAAVTGGRGCPVYEVTNLDDSGPGSLRDGLSQGNRTVVFRVSGTMRLKAPLVLAQPNVTIAGQTAPGDGICLRDFPFSIRTENVIVRFLRSRLGDVTAKQADGITLDHGCRDVILDHCSATWSIDEALSLAGNVGNVTVQWCLIAEGLNRSKHPKGAHGYGSLARANGAVSLHHNLWAHNDSRNPRLGDNYGRPPFPTFDVRNNVMYDYGSTCSGLTQGNLRVNYVANFIRPGPSSRAQFPITVGAPSDLKFFIKDNVFEGNDELTADNGRSFSRTESDGARLVQTVAAPFPAPPVHTVAARHAFEAVLASAGASRPRRDAADARIVAEVRQRGGAIIDSQDQVGGWPELTSAPAPADRDHDGMPDAWETNHRLDPDDPADGFRPAAGSTGAGYTNLEIYLAALASGEADAAASATISTSAAPGRDGERWWSHVRALADDRLAGRETGSEGHRIAARYVADQFRRLGLAPAGADGYFQPVSLRRRQIDERRSSLALVRSPGSDLEALTLGEDAILSPRVAPAGVLEAPLVFAGYGLTIPEANHDDFAGLDVRGKVVVHLMGAPPSIPGPLAAHMQSAHERTKLLKRLGAIGTVSLPNPKNMDIPWERVKVLRFLPAMSVSDPALDDYRGLMIAISVNPARADRWLARSGHSFQEILDAADGGRPLPHFALAATVRASVAANEVEVESQNVAARLVGSDPVLKEECVVFTAHLDHLGIGQPIRGDAIYNGAMDNASGVATLLDVAERIKESGRTPRRSVLFVAVTGEEKGLLGSRYFAARPTVDAAKIVANLNVDMFLPLYPLRILTVFGIDESDLGNDARAVAEAVGIPAQGDLEPKRNLFIRSDQYSFIRRGIPALALKVGFAPGSAEERIAKLWLTERYHAPSDDVDQPVDKQAAADFNTAAARLLVRIANRPERPRWKETSFFKRFAP